MKIVALLSWFDEPPSLLAASIASLGKLGIDHLIAVDGRYLLYQDDRTDSGTHQHLLVLEACRGAGIGCTLHVPPAPYPGNEVEKRTLMFRLAEQVTEPGVDWLMIMDADQIASGITAHELHQRLSSAQEDVARVRFWQDIDPARRQGHDFHMPALANQYVPIFFRATPGLHCQGNHYTYVTGDGRYLWGQEQTDPLEPSFDLDPLTIEHRPHLRPVARLDAKRGYYQRRDELGIEWPDCDLCKTRRADRSLPYQIEPHGDGAFIAGAVRVCEGCEPDVLTENRARLAELGHPDLDPADLVKTS